MNSAVKENDSIYNVVAIGGALSGTAAATLDYTGANRGRLAYTAPVTRPGVDCTS
jgi:hypothetical protein